MLAPGAQDLSREEALRLLTELGDSPRLRHELRRLSEE